MENDRQLILELTSSQPFAISPATGVVTWGEAQATLASVVSLLKQRLSIDRCLLSGSAVQWPDSDGRAKSKDRSNAPTLALWFDDPIKFSIALLACAIVDCDVFLLPNKTSDSLNRAATQCQGLLSDEVIAGCDLPQLEFPTSQMADSSQLPSKCELALHNIFISLSTSGSTGIPKLVQKTWQQMWTEVSAIAQRLDKVLLAQKPVVLSSVFPQHMYGLTFRVFLCLYAKLAFYGDTLAYPEELLGTTKQFESCLWVSSPTLLHAFNAQHQSQQVHGHLIGIFSSGGPLNSKQKQFLQEELKAPVMEIYGSTETGVIAYRLDHPYWRFFSSVNHTINADQTLTIESAWCTAAEAMSDVVVFHDTGFELLGRADRIVKLADRRVSLFRIEQILMGHVWVHDAYVFQHPKLAKRLVACIALSEAGLEAWLNQGRKSVIECLKQSLALVFERIDMPRFWRFDRALPRNAQGKLIKARVEQWAQTPVTEVEVMAEQAIDLNHFTATWRIPVDLLYFNGHFEQFALVPGVVQLKWVLQQLKRLEWLSCLPEITERLKFQGFLRPNDICELRLQRDPVKRQITFALSCEGKAISSGRFVLDAVGVERE